MIRSLMFVGLSLLTHCAATEPNPIGSIVGRCRIEANGSAVAIDPCPTNFYALCIANSDAGNGSIVARCCLNGVSEAVCAERAGLLTDGGVTNNQ